jgi:predicted AlkP superfamily pyrophosphatase or phosphodiesterase
MTRALITDPDGRLRPGTRPHRAAGLLLAVVLCFAALALPGCRAGAGGSEGGLSASAPGGEAPPALLVFIVVDQLGADLFDAHRDLFTGGFRRLMEEGRVFDDFAFEHAVTETAPGHATLATGTFPARHGMVSNRWWEDDEGDWVEIFDVIDPTAPMVDDPALAGGSPAPLLRSGIADWMRSHDAASRVVSLSGKARGAVLMAGRSPGHVFWLEVDPGRFSTSTFYGSRLPGWVDRFNRNVLPGLAGDSTWTPVLTPEQAARTRGDTANYEGDGVNVAFPHRFVDEGASVTGGFWGWWATTPGPDEAILLLAREAVRAERLGARPGRTDLLALSLSQADIIGHAFGPWSREQLDNLIRLDAHLDAFLGWLDAELGEGRYLVVLTSDHGAAEAPEARRARGLEGQRLSPSDGERFQEALTYAVRTGATISEEAFTDTLATQVRRIPGVARAWTRAEIAALDAARPASGEGDPAEADSFAVMERRSTLQERPAGLLGRFGVAFQFEPWTIPWSYPRGTTHGTPYLYDRKVPFIVMGPGVEPGVDRTSVGATDVAPTLARFLGIPFPEDLDGIPRALSGPPAAEAGETPHGATPRLSGFSPRP